MSPEELICGSCEMTPTIPTRKVTRFRRIKTGLQPLCNACHVRLSGLTAALQQASGDSSDPYVSVSLEDGMDEYRVQLIHES